MRRRLSKLAAFLFVASATVGLHVMDDQKQYLRRAEAAAYLQKRYNAYKTQTLAKLAVTGGGPRFRKMGAFAYYSAADLDEWAASRMSEPVHSTTELAAARAASERRAEAAAA